MPRLFLVFLIAVGLAAPLQAAERPCPTKPQRMPPAIESADLPEVSRFSNLVTFAAVPSLEFPQRAWVIRLFQRTHGQPATLTVVRLLGRYDCNIYDVETRWEVPLTAADYETVARSIVPHVTPPPGTFTPRNDGEGISVVADGTGLDLRVQAAGWQVTRGLNHGQREGAELSAIFRRLLMLAVPAPERPDDSWRTRR